MGQVLYLSTSSYCDMYFDCSMHTCEHVACELVLYVNWYCIPMITACCFRGFFFFIPAHRSQSIRTSKRGKIEVMYEGYTEQGSPAPANGHHCDEWPPSCW